MNAHCSARMLRTLFFVMTLNEWSDIVLLLSKHADPFFVTVFFMLYVVVAAYAMVSLVTGIISESLVTNRSKDQEFMVQEVEKQEKKVEKVADVISTVRAALIEVVKTVEDNVTVEEDDGTGVGFEQNDSPTTEPLSECAVRLDLADLCGGSVIVFEGVEYTFDPEENRVDDDELAEVGTWDGEKVEFLNATAAKSHRVRKLTNKND